MSAADRPLEDLSLTELLDRRRDREARELADFRTMAADAVVLEAYDRHRGARPFDMTGTRRRRVLIRLEADVAERRRDAERRGLELDPPTEAELQAALERQARQRLQRPDVSDSVLEAIADTRDELELDSPAALERALGRTAPRRSGGSRRRGR